MGRRFAIFSFTGELKLATSYVDRAEGELDRGDEVASKQTLKRAQRGLAGMNKLLPSLKDTTHREDFDRQLALLDGAINELNLAVNLDFAVSLTP